MTRAKSILTTLGFYVLAATVGSNCSIMAGDPADPAVKALLTAHNRERKQGSLRPLELSPRLCEAATAHARDMAKHRRLDHKGSDGSTMLDRVKRLGYVYVRVGENIADGQSSVDQVMDTWMKSPGHRSNIMGDYTEMGAARVEDDEGVNYWCVDFGIPIPRLEPDQAAAAVIKEINRDRESGREAVLEADPGLGRAAMAISAAVAAKDSLELTADPFKLIDEKALEGREIRLQLSANTPTAKLAAKELEGAQAQDLATFRDVGVGYALAKSGTPYWCAIFAKPAPGRRPGKPK